MQSTIEGANKKRLFQELFGSDDEDEHYSENDKLIDYSDILPGLKLFPQFLSTRQDAVDAEGKKAKTEGLLPTASELLNAIMAAYPFTENLNQVMSFGVLPSFIHAVVNSLEAHQSLFPEEIMQRRPLFDQMICNYYEPGQGITPHVDLLSKFDDGIVIVSLGSSCVMDFRPVTNIDEAEKYSEKNKDGNDGDKKSVLLQPGDVLSISGDARYKWMHGIEKHLVDEWEGKSIPRGKRVSVTLRRLLPTT